ncbi:unnamed protein product [Alopecurus aequalis]
MQIKRPGKRKKICMTTGTLIRVNPLEEEFGCPSDSGAGVWSLLSEEVAENIDDSVVSLASFHPGGYTEDTLFFACTGTIIESNTTTARILTSLSLVRSIDDDDSNILHDLRIRLRLPNNFLTRGWLEYYDLKYNVAVVRTPPFYVFRAACLDHQRQFEYDTQVVAVGRCFNSGKLMATDGLLTENNWSRKELAVSTCQITMTGVGGPLVDFNGDFVGMNFYGMEETSFLPRDKILELLMQFRTTALCCKKIGDSKTERGASKERETPESHMSDLEGSSSQEMKTKKQKTSICTICDPKHDTALKDKLLKSLHYLDRWPYDWGFVLEDDGMHLRYNFEEEFSEDTWSKLTKTVASNMSRSVVSLASFSGGARLFACTGVCIDRNGSTTRVLTSGSLVRSSVDESEVAHDLKIKVCLPDMRIIPGTLQHYNLQYNVAVITIEKFRCTRTANIDNTVKTGNLSEVLAIGRVYESGKLMAASGTLIDKRSEVQCEELKISTCEITKAGIGGPLIDFNGNFLGMNFFGLEETPYMPKDIIRELLENFDSERTAHAEGHNSDEPTGWPVPKAYWCYPSWHSLKDEVDLLEVFGEGQYYC